MSNRKPTEILKEEHVDVLKKLDAFGNIINRLDKKEEVSGELKELASYFNADFWVHFAKEEEALFPEIETFMPREGGPTGMMLIEHEQLRKTNEQIQKTVDEYIAESGTSNSAQMIQQHANDFIGLLREHINKEDNILFMMADMHFDAAQVDKVNKLFSEIESRYANS